MQTVTPAFIAAISGDHDIAALVTVEAADGTLLWSSDASSARVVGGQVTMEKSADIRTRSEVKIVDPTGALVPVLATDILTPYGNVIKVFRGVLYADGSTELVQLCTNRISTVQVDDSQGSLAITVSGNGYERIVQRNVIPYFWPLTSMVSSIGLLALVDGSNNPVTPSQCPFYTDFVSVLISDRYPGVVFNTTSYSGPSPFTTPSGWAQQQYVGTGISTRINYTGSIQLSQGADPWQKAKDIATLMGCDLYFDRYGVCTLIRDPNLAIMDGTVVPQPVMSFIEGQTATFMNLTRKLDDSNGFNACVVVGDGSALVGPVQTPYYQNVDNSGDAFNLVNPFVQASDPLLGYPVVIDNDPTSPTYFFGPYGKVIHVENNSLVFDAFVAQGYSETLLKRAIGVQEIVTFDGIVNPALDVDDVISVQRTRAGVSGSVLYVIDSLTIPLLAKDSMKVTLRERRALTI